MGISQAPPHAVPRRGNEIDVLNGSGATAGRLPPSTETALQFSSGRSANPQELFAVRRLSQLLGSRATRADTIGGTLSLFGSA